MLNTTATGPLKDFKNFYLQVICPYPNFISCGIGSVLNILNIVVFTRKSMASPMTTIFLHLSIVDLAVLLINIPSTWHVCVEHDMHNQHNHNSEMIHLSSRCLTTFFFYVSVWFTVMLAIWRYMAVAHPLKECRWCNIKNTKLAVFAGYIFGAVLALPQFLALSIQSGYQNTRTIYTIEYCDQCPWFYTHFVLYGTVLKLIPSIVLSIFSYKLIKALGDLEKKRQSLHFNSSSNMQKISKTKRKTDFTTTMLFGVLVLFLISEVPSGLLGLSSIVLGNQFRADYFSPMIHVFNTIRLISISITFLVYYNLSVHFRKVFKALFNVEKLHIQSNNLSSQKSDESQCTSFRECN